MVTEKNTFSKISKLFRNIRSVQYYVIAILSIKYEKKIDTYNYKHLGSSYFYSDFSCDSVSNITALRNEFYQEIIVSVNYKMFRICIYLYHYG